MHQTRSGTLLMALYGALAILGTIGLRSAGALALLCLFGVLSPGFALIGLLLVAAMGSAVAVWRGRTAMKVSAEERVSLVAQIEKNGLIRFAREGDTGS